MMSKVVSPWLIVVIIFLLPVVLGVVVMSSERNYKEKCEKLGGEVYDLRGINLCLNDGRVVRI